MEQLKFRYGALKKQLNCYTVISYGGHARVNVVRARFRKAVTNMAATAGGSGKSISSTVQMAFFINFAELYNVTISNITH